MLGSKINPFHLNEIVKILANIGVNINEKYNCDGTLYSSHNKMKNRFIYITTYVTTSVFEKLRSVLSEVF